MRFLFLILYPAASSASSAAYFCHTPSFTQHLCHTPSFTNPLSHTIFVTHNSVTHAIFVTPSLSPTIFHTQLCHTPSVTHIFLPHHISHAKLCHTPSVTHIFVTHHLSHTIFQTHLCHSHTPSLSHTIVALGDIHLRFAWQAHGRRGTWSHPPAFCVPGAWQAWHLVTSTFVLCGRRGTYGTGLALMARLGRF